MKLRALLWTGCISAAMAVSAQPAAAAAAHECVAATPTAASSTWNFKGEANTIFKDIQSDAVEAQYHADKLQTFTRDDQVSWEAHAGQLEDLRHEIDDMGSRLCRLETIRRVVSPWQQQEIDRIAVDVRLMADNAQDAIAFVNANQNNLWLATYDKYVDNLYNESRGLDRSVGTAVQFAGISKEYRNLGHSLGRHTSS